MKTVDRRIMTVKELSDYLKVHTNTIYRHLKLGQLLAFKVGADWRFRVESIDRWLPEQESSSADWREFLSPIPVLGKVAQTAAGSG